MTEKAGATRSSYTSGSGMQSAGVDRSGFRALHTALPFVCRQQLSLVRTILGGLGLAMYVLAPVSWSMAVWPLLACYILWSLYVVFRQPGFSLENPFFQLSLDVGLFFTCAAHPSSAGLWLATITYAYILLLTSLLYHWHIVVIMVVTAGGFLLAFRPDPAARIWPAILLGGVIAVALSVQRRAMEDRLRAALRRSVLSRSEAEIAREQERQRIAHDFHDGPLQSFISFQMRLEIVRKLMSRDTAEAMRELIQLQDLGRAQVTELRAFVRQMQPAEVTPATLGQSIREACDHFEHDSGITCELYCGDLSVIADALALDVLQIVREALNNARKHSKGSRISLEVEADAEALIIRAEDDGSGYPFSGIYSLDELEVLRLGPRSIKRRVRTLGGDLVLESKPSEGSTLKIRVPVGQ